MNKKYKELNDSLDKTLQAYETKTRHLTDCRERALQDLEKAKAERSQAMESGDLEKARKLKTTVSDFASDVEAYGAQLERVKAEKKTVLEELARSIAAQVNHEEETLHAADVKKIIKQCADLLSFLEQMEETRKTGIDIVRRAEDAAGFPLTEDRSYIYGMINRRRLLYELYEAVNNIVMYSEGKQVGGVPHGERTKNWL